MGLLISRPSTLIVDIYFHFLIYFFFFFYLFLLLNTGQFSFQVFGYMFFVLCPRDFLSNSIYFKTNRTFCLMRRFLLSNQMLLQTTSFFLLLEKKGKLTFSFVTAPGCSTVKLERYCQALQPWFPPLVSLILLFVPLHASDN